MWRKPTDLRELFQSTGDHKYVRSMTLDSPIQIEKSGTRDVKIDFMRDIRWRRENGIKAKQSEGFAYSRKERHKNLPPLLQYAPAQFGHGVQRFFAP